MSYRTWSNKETEYLLKKYGSMTVSAIAKKLNRTNLSVIRKANRLNLGPVYEAQETITATELSRALGRSSSVVLRWICKNGLKSTLVVAKEKRKYQMIAVEDFWKFAKEHPEFMKWDLYERNTLLPEPKWLDEEIQNYFKTKNKKKDKKWTKAEECYLLAYYQQGKQIKEISQLMERSEDAIWFRLKKLNVKKRVIQLKWGSAEDEILINMRKQGKMFKEIAEELGRSTESVQRRHSRIKEQNNMIN